MNPNAFSRLIRRISQAIGLASKPSRSAVASDLSLLSSALEGNKTARISLESKFPSGVPVMAAFDAAFTKAGLDHIEMIRVSSNWKSANRSTPVDIFMNDGRVSKVIVAGKAVKSFDEAAAAYQYFKRNPRLAGLEDLPEPMSESAHTINTQVPCTVCNGTIVVDDSFLASQACPACDSHHEICSNCGKWVAADKMMYGSCYLCGHSSGGISEFLDPSHSMWEYAPGDKVPMEGSSIDRKTGKPTSYVMTMMELDDGTPYPSCNCMAWKMFKGAASPAARTCKHLKSMFGEQLETERSSVMNEYAKYMANIKR